MSLLTTPSALAKTGLRISLLSSLRLLRAIPGLTVMRPADANETAGAWKAALTRKGPTVLALSRQKLPIIEGAL